MTALVTVTASIAAAVLVVGPGYQTSQARMRSGSIWLASAPTGEATLLDGVSAEVKTQVPVVRAGAGMAVVQRDSAAVVLNRETGELSRVDGATEKVSPPVEVLPAGDGLDVLSGARGLYALDIHSGLVASVDPETLKPRGEPERLAAGIRPDSAVVDGRGSLWAIDDTTGDVVWLDEIRRRTRSGAKENGRLTITSGRPALVDPDRGTAELIAPETGRVEKSLHPQLQAGDAVVVGGSVSEARVLIAAAGRGELVTCTFETGSCAAPVPVGAAGAEFGTPIEVDGHAVVPDYSTGQATIVNLATSRVVAQRQLFDQPTRFELLAHDGIVFFNDANGDKAGVLELSGDIRAITKYTEKPADDEAPLTQNTPAQPNQVAKAGQDKPASDAGVSGRTVQPSRVEPGPGPVSGASIVVEPGNQGVVGDEFELTMVVPSSPGAATVWQFGDGTGATGGTVRHSWQQAGTFTVRAASTFRDGARAEAETTVIVDPRGTPPRITALNVRRPRPVLGEPVRFSADTTAVPDGWAWTVTKPGSATPVATSRTAEFTHAFTATGTYTVSLMITADGRTAESSRQFRVVRGAVKGWGHSYTDTLNIPPTASSGVVAISTTGGHVLALKSDGSVIAWGDGYKFGLTTIPPEATSGVVAIAIGGLANYVLKDDGSVFGWGDRSMGQLDLPPEVSSDVVAIASGGYNMLALKKDGSVIAWGGPNLRGELDVPQAAKSGVVAIEASTGNGIAVKADGSVIVWGDDCWENNGPTNCQDGAPTTGAVSVAANGSNFVALMKDRSVYFWGPPGQGRYYVPPPPMSDVIAVSSQDSHALALKADGSVLGWGWNDRGQATVPPEYNRGVTAIATTGGASFVIVEGDD
ncbi:PKD domain-containing protein [Lentzea albidocapillata]|uniref:PKD domain-containing protein n=1 Tax=Lentzea albidocapillata TaxID=40571 RepID=UPI00068DC9CD|nr:PKD domain-containing protein [Lentzea albidocapillata]